MIANLKYELVKLFTVRSTYVMSLVAVAFTILVMVITLVNLKAGQLNGTAIAHVVTDSTIMASLLGSIVAILLVGHEYRYNMITYTLTASRSRTKVLLAKVVTTVLFSAVLAALCVGVGLLCYHIGLHIRHFALPPQTIGLAGMISRTLLYCVGNALLGLVIALLVRNIIFAIVAIFVLPTIEQILTVWLKHNAAYLPTTALSQVNYVPGQASAIFSPLKGGLIFLAYLVAGWLVAWFLFLRKDAN